MQALLADALKKGAIAEKAVSRRELINADDDSYRLINHHQIYNGMYFGQLVFFESGKSQALITLDSDAISYKIDSMTPTPVGTKGPNKAKREFVDSILYFGLLDDHMVLMQSKALTSRELEAHLGWLLGTLVSSIDKDSAVILGDKPTEATIKKIEKQPVKSVHVGAPVYTQEEVNDEDDKNAKETKTADTVELSKRVRFIPIGTGVNVIKAALGEGWFTENKLEDSLDDANLKVSLEITYMRKTSKVGQKMLDNIATAMRHSDESDVRIDLHGGGSISGKDLKLSGKVSVKYNDGLVDEGDLYHQMHSWLVSKVTSQEIEIEEDK
jgi:hypothetical protein